jgi:probable HAF family extracellular repeat protein
VPKDLSPDASNSEATAVNDAGQVAGAVNQTIQRPAIFPDGRVRLLDGGTGPGGRAHDINDLGWVVGELNPAGGAGPKQAFLWRNGVLTNLNDLVPDDAGWNLEVAFAVNTAGQIVGYGTKNGQQRAFLATPEK